MRGTNRLARPLFWDVRVIAEFRSGLTAGTRGKGKEKSQTERKAKNCSTHRQEFTLSDSTRCVKKRQWRREMRLPRPGHILPLRYVWCRALNQAPAALPVGAGVAAVVVVAVVACGSCNCVVSRRRRRGVPSGSLDIDRREAQQFRLEKPGATGSARRFALR